MLAFVCSIAAGGNPSGVTTGSVDTTGANLLVMSVSSYTGGTYPTISDSKSNTWTPLTDRTGGTSGGTSLWRETLFYCAAPTVGTGHTFSASGSNSFATIAAAAFSGAAGSPFDVENGAGNDSSTTIQPGSVTPGQDNSLIISGLTFNAPGDSASINSSFTIGSQVAPVNGENFGSAIAYKIQTSAAAENPTWTTGSVSFGMSASIAVFKPASAGQALTLDLSDGVTLLEARGSAAAFARAASPETLTLAEAMTLVAGFSRGLADAAQVSEALSFLAARARSLGDALLPDDSVTRSAAYARAMSDPAALEEAIGIVMGLARVLSDALGPAETVSKSAAFARAIADPAAVGESLAFGFARAFSEAAALAESVSAVLVLVRDLSDPLAPGESLAIAAARVRALSESATLGEALGFVAHRARAVADALAMDEVLLRRSVFARGFGDAASMGEALVKYLISGGMFSSIFSADGTGPITTARGSILIRNLQQS